MYKCESCNRNIGPNIPEYRFVTKQRQVTYPVRDYYERRQKVHDRGGSGTQIVETILLCPFCALTQIRARKNDELSIFTRKIYMQTKTKVTIRPEQHSE